MIDTNELWLKASTTAAGALVAEATFEHFARGGALSVVVHDPTTAAKVACADLLADDTVSVELEGTLEAFAGATPGDMAIAGSIKATRTGASTTFALDVTGLDKAALGYGSHIHNEPCEVATGGGHYKLDPIVVDTIETNEIWLPVTGYVTTGTATATMTVPSSVRHDAQSIVIHRTITDLNKPKVACANLTRKTAPLALATTGTAFPLAQGVPVTGIALMTRKLTGVTEVAVVMTGLTPNTTYQAHVHNTPCAVESGGGHFKFDKAVTDVIATNEMWFELTADAKGAGHDSMWVDRTAAADAQSLVVRSKHVL